MQIEAHFPRLSWTSKRYFAWPLFQHFFGNEENGGIMGIHDTSNLIAKTQASLPSWKAMKSSEAEEKTEPSENFLGENEWKQMMNRSGR